MSICVHALLQIPSSFFVPNIVWISLRTFHTIQLLDPIKDKIDLKVIYLLRLDLKKLSSCKLPLGLGFLDFLPLCLVQRPALAIINKNINKIES